jgi:hypothetical protein
VDLEMTVHPIHCLSGWFSQSVCLVALLACALPALGADEIRIVETRNIPVEPAPAGATHELRLSLYAFRNTRWSSQEILTALPEGAGLLGQCGVALARAELHVVEAPSRFRYYHTPVSRELLRRLKVSRPALFFVDDTLNNPAFDAEAIGRENAVTQPELADTVWIAHGARDLPQTMAHELVHVLSDDGTHSTEPGNLMRATTSRRNTHLTEVQCAGLRSRGEANGLLTARPRSLREEWGARSRDR